MSRRTATIIDGDSGDTVIPIDLPASDASAAGGDTGPVETINGFETVDPDTASISGGGGGGTGKRRGRPPGSTNRAQTSRKADIGGLEQILLSLHFMGAAICECPELQLEDKEAKALADAVVKVSAHYDHRISPKTVAWVNLAMIAGGIYGGRALAIRARFKAEEERRAGSIQMRPNVVDFEKRPAGQQAAPKPAAGVPQTPADMFGPLYTGTQGPEFLAGE